MVVLFLAACGSQQETNKRLQVQTDMPEMIDVTIQLPEDFQPNEKVTIEGKVTQGNELVNDANEVKFELWEAGDAEEDHEMIMDEYQGDGIYSINKTFEKDGHYSVIAHVTARDMHNMPKQEFVVGDPGEKPAEDSEEEENS
ncbi:FixH family protein [Salinibacillus xinjiangensis]|uniref:YtkA-like domain-containing protein n=1 Tax=Salinibacillus xinjiangensis TaxID=1229268 RepID=A0A6G1X4H4_9BACI|nr:FixH family protein [Salinibacillus xinjiangensis]MRG85847.1 hypothetical protein [Salinibacillus xinjiangensis]